MLTKSKDCEKLLDSSMTVCPGISVEEYESYKVIRYDQKKCTHHQRPIHPYCLLSEVSYVVSRAKEHKVNRGWRQKSCVLNVPC